MGEKVPTFLRGYGLEEPCDGGLDLLEATGVCLAQECLELGERLLDRVQVGTIAADRTAWRRPRGSLAVWQGPYGC